MIAHEGRLDFDAWDGGPPGPAQAWHIGPARSLWHKVAGEAVCWGVNLGMPVGFVPAVARVICIPMVSEYGVTTDANVYDDVDYLGLHGYYYRDEGDLPTFLASAVDLVADVGYVDSPVDVYISDQTKLQAAIDGTGTPDSVAAKATPAS